MEKHQPDLSIHRIWRGQRERNELVQKLNWSIQLMHFELTNSEVKVIRVFETEIYTYKFEKAPKADWVCITGRTGGITNIPIPRGVPFASWTLSELYDLERDLDKLLRMVTAEKDGNSIDTSIRNKFMT